MEATRVRWSTVENMVSTHWTSTALCRWEKCLKNKSNPDQCLNWVWGLKLKLPLTWLLLRIVNSVALTTTWLIFARTGGNRIENPYKPLLDILPDIFWGILISLYQSPARRTAGTWFAKMGRNWSATSVALMITCSRFPVLIMILSFFAVGGHQYWLHL